MLSFIEIGPWVPEIFEGGFTIYGHSGHLGHVTWFIYIHIGFLFLYVDASYEIWL